MASKEQEASGIYLQPKRRNKGRLSNRSRNLQRRPNLLQEIVTRLDHKNI